MKKLWFMVLLLAMAGMLMAEVIFEDGFENGNTHNTAIAGWTQVSVSGSGVWTANDTLTNYNRTPRTGSWNAFLAYGNSRWMFKEVTLTAGTDYSLSFYARQDETSGTTIKASYGTTASVAGMTNPIIAQTNVTNGDYQLFTGSFNPSTSGTYYIGIYATLNYTPWYISIDDISLVSIPLALPSIANNVSPTNSSTNISINQTLNWTAGAGSSPTGYKMYFGTTNPPTAMTDLGLVTTWTPSPALNYNQTYYWQVVPYNTIGSASDCPVWSFTTRNDPTQPIPYTQDFNAATTLPTDWTSNMTISATHGNASNGIYKNLWSSAPSANFVTCPIGPLAAVSELKFDYRIVDYDDYPSTATALGANDKIEIQISTDNGITYTTIYTINQANHVSSTSFANMSVDLSAYANQKPMFKFLATWGVGDYYVDCDNFQVREVPGAPIFAVSPLSKNFGDVQIGSESTPQTFTITNNGAGTLVIPTQPIIEGGNMNQFVLTDTNTYPLSLTANQSATLQVKFVPTAEGAKSAVLNIAYNDGTLQTSSLPLTGNGLNPIIGTFPHLQTFETYPPLFWTETTGLLADPVVTSGTTSAWGADGFGNNGTTGAVGVNVYSYSTTKKEWMITPSIDLGTNVAGGYKVEFDLALCDYASTNPITSDVNGTTGVDDKFAVVISTDNGTTWTSANTLALWDNAGSANVYNNISNTGDHITLNLVGYSGLVKIGFYVESTVSNADNDLFIDNFAVTYDATLPVELSSFDTAVLANNTVSLTWVTQSENNLFGYHLYRGTENQIASADRITSTMIAPANTSTETTYSFTDSEVTAATTYYYWLQSVESNGTSEYFGPYTVRTNDATTTPTLPSVTAMRNAYPNPFNGTTHANFDVDVKDGETAQLTIYNIKGQVVKTYSNIIPGNHKFMWNGKDSNNNRCAAGIYFYKLSSPTFSSTKKMMYLK